MKLNSCALKTILVTLIATESAFLVYAGIKTASYLRLKNVLGVATVVPLNKKKLIFPESYELKYFYETAPGITMENPVDWLDHTPKYTINSDSLNERFEYATTVSPGVYRIITMGDSFTFGHYVNTADNWPEQLEVTLNDKLICPDIDKFEVINLGQPGYDVQYDIYRYKKRGSKYNPDLVIWLPNVARWNELKFNEIFLCEASMSAYAAEEIEKGDYGDCQTRAKANVLKKYNQEELVTRSRKFLHEFTGIYSKKLFLLSLSDSAEVYKRGLKLLQKERPQIYFSDALPDLQTSGYLLPDGHPSATGHAAISRAVMSELLNQKIICP